MFTITNSCLPFSFGLAIALSVTIAGAGHAQDYFKIRIVDQETGRGVPLVELRTTANHYFVTDSNGLVAFREPGLMDQDVFFHIRSHGYRFPKDAFGYRGTKLRPTPGGEATLTIERENIAQRLYRLTGYGVYRDTVLLDEDSPLRAPLLNAQVTGSDSAQMALYREKLYWFWGDTHFPRYPLGNFHVPGATSELPENGGLDPRLGVDFSYFLAPNGSAAETARMGDQGFIWLSGLAAFTEAGGREQMLAHFVRGVPDDQALWRIIERGVMEFDDRTRRFRKSATWSSEGPFPDGAHTVIEGGFVYFTDPFPRWRVRLNAEDFGAQSSYETFSCLRNGTTAEGGRFDRNDDGSIRFSWKPNTEALGYREHAQLIRNGTLAQEDYPWSVTDSETGQALTPHRGSIAWNKYRQRWVMILGIATDLGSIYYSEAANLSGPWRNTRCIVRHDNYSFYNPVHHPELDQDGGRYLFFEGTYTQAFSTAPTKTPLYDYNQIMYCLDLANPRLALSHVELPGSKRIK